MKSLILNAPFNNLSFGNISINFAKELYKKGVHCAIFPIGDKVDLSAFDKLTPEFTQWLQNSINSRFTSLDPDSTTLQMWHLNGSENRLSRNKILYSFYELNDPTEIELSLAKHQDHCVFSSRYAAQQFNDKGCDNTTNISPGFDTDFHLTGKKYLPNKIHFGLMGKFEKRKRTAQILKNWAAKYGNNYNYQLSCCINNSFIQPAQLDQLIGQALGGKRYGNINFLPFMKTNSEVNEYINAIDIELSGLSGAEGWNLPAFNASSLGKWSIVINATSHTDWADSLNSVLIEPSGQTSSVDGIFFNHGQPFNQGSIFTISDEEMIHAFELAENKSKSQNTEGLKLPEKFSYSNTIDNLLALTEKTETVSH
tara:strand:- start:2099 stop:3202 length:1104 start_codon:yes stop_codon:yes gene_type:complete